MSKQFNTVLGPEYYDSVPDYPNLAVQHVCEAALTRFFGDQLDVSFLPDADQVLFLMELHLDAEDLLALIKNIFAGPLS